jgi:polysaccharide export outer membrane protein
VSTGSVHRYSFRLFYDLFLFFALYRYMKKFFLGVVSLLFLFSLQSCLTPSKLYLFHDQQVAKQTLDSLEQAKLVKIKKGDRLQVTVNSPDVNITAFLNPFGVGNSTSFEQQNTNGFLVSQEGFIDFPKLGKVKVDSLTTREAADLIYEKLSFWYKDLYVDVNLTGRVFFINGRNGTDIQMRNERLTIFEALSQSGVQDPYDKRNKVWLVREENGERDFVQLNLASKEIFNSPYYYLRNNDLIYVRPGRLSSLMSASSPTRSILTATGLLLTLIIALRR